ncbi:universal stress protein [Streptomyces cocklensis]|jgi:nucleotide-binding universal stress UspA family protein|uniref:Nucleotide-binding universal stress protein, UspA family n=1 Tax=Actinacidiphila cocklensis TaxID=887465 RepID=A0A9W4GSG8_9ACTN|nr:universal stress protein [Actinacidiphila cocklensis]MDD1059911.1 universal stress protein [Actinacidiphila cocklensis]WSX72774.1 universal stress protein [Streptomyces sp. NBC_00899]WSX81158.1 universal stress protein [Streptomyces sp. NBC_00899]CAG6395859.1 Nucleotide-binding universal stress protein, UspA family [Actinacidiphila cocklensis]
MSQTNVNVVAGVSTVRQNLNGPVIDWAAAEAAARGLPLHVVHAQEWPRGVPPQPGPEHPAHLWAQHFRAGGEQVLDTARRAASARWPGLTVTTELAAGRPTPVLLESGESAALIVLGARRLTGVEGAFAGRGKGHALLGHLPCPVALVPEPAASVPDDAPVVVGVDGSPSSTAAVDLAFAEADAAKTALVAVAVRNPRDYAWAEYREDTEVLVSEQLAGHRRRYPDTEVRQEILRGDPALMLASASHNARCLVVGSRGRGGFRGLLLGSTGRALIHHTDCPLLVAPRPPQT